MGQNQTVDDAQQTVFERVPGSQTHDLRPIETEPTVHRRKLDVDPPARDRQQQIVQERKGGGKRDEKSRAEQHGAEILILPEALVIERAGPKHAAKDCQARIGGDINVEWLERSPEAVARDRHRNDRQENAPKIWDHSLLCICSAVPYAALR